MEMSHRLTGLVEELLRTERSYLMRIQALKKVSCAQQAREKKLMGSPRIMQILYAISQSKNSAG